ncbi:2748_t:CDS:1, partial [Dentiscutata heterogama]
IFEASVSLPPSFIVSIISIFGVLSWVSTLVDLTGRDSVLFTLDMSNTWTISSSFLQ